LYNAFTKSFTIKETILIYVIELSSVKLSRDGHLL